MSGGVEHDALGREIDVATSGLGRRAAMPCKGCDKTESCVRGGAPARASKIESHISPQLRKPASKPSPWSNKVKEG
jgi:hypothetical protein